MATDNYGTREFYADRWETLSWGSGDGEAMRREAREAREVPTFKCGNCGGEVFDRPAVGRWCSGCGADWL